MPAPAAAQRVHGAHAVPGVHARAWPLLSVRMRREREGRDAAVSTARPLERAAATQAATLAATQAATLAATQVAAAVGAAAVLALRQEQEHRLRCQRLVLGSAAQAEAADR